jgi:hypothetical protein
MPVSTADQNPIVLIVIVPFAVSLWGILFEPAISVFMFFSLSLNSGN